jgi:hypothetical protein
MEWTVVLAGPAKKSLKRIPAGDKARIWPRKSQLKGLKSVDKDTCRPRGVCVAASLSPRRGLFFIPLSAQGLRPGLHSCAASRLELRGRFGAAEAAPFQSLRRSDRCRFLHGAGGYSGDREWVAVFA